MEEHHEQRLIGKVFIGIKIRNFEFRFPKIINLA